MLFSARKLDTQHPPHNFYQRNCLLQFSILSTSCSSCFNAHKIDHLYDFLFLSQEFSEMIMKVEIFEVK